MIFGDNILGDIRWTKLLVKKKNKKQKNEGKQSVNINGTTPNSGPHGPIICELLASRHPIMKHVIIVSYVIQRLKKIISAFSNIIFIHESTISNFNNHLPPSNPGNFLGIFVYENSASCNKNCCSNTLHLKRSTSLGCWAEEDSQLCFCRQLFLCIFYCEVSQVNQC